MVEGIHIPAIFNTPNKPQNEYIQYEVRILRGYSILLGRDYSFVTKTTSASDLILLLIIIMIVVIITKASGS